MAATLTFHCGLILTSHHDNGSYWLCPSIIHVNFLWLKNNEWL